MDQEELAWLETWAEPSVAVVHDHPTLPFIEIIERRCGTSDPTEEDRANEEWQFRIWGHEGALYFREDHTEQEMLSLLTGRAEEYFLHELGPFWVLRHYLETGEYRKEIDAVMRKHGQWPFWRRTEAALGRCLDLQPQFKRMRRRLRDWRFRRGSLFFP